MHDLLALTPAGHLVMLRQNNTEPAAVAGDGSARFAAIAECFAASQAQGLIALADGRPDPTWPLPWTFWREFAARYLTALCQMPPSSRLIDPIDPPDEADLSRLSLGIPPHARRGILQRRGAPGGWSDLRAWCSERIGRHGRSSQDSSRRMRRFGAKSPVSPLRRCHGVMWQSMFS
jgi:non-specific serine/threonine protein kinase